MVALRKACTFVLSVCVAVASSQVIWPANLFAAPSVAVPTAAPSSIAVGQAVNVTVSCVITTSLSDPTIVVNGVYLQRVDAKGKFVANLGTMVNDGTDGGAPAGRHTFKFTVPLNEPALGVVRLQVSVPFKGVAKRTMSAILDLPVVASNPPPVITSTPATDALDDHVYYYQVTASDPDGELITFALQSGPAGMTLLPTTGFLSWTPTTDQVGDNSVTVVAKEPSGGSATQTFIIHTKAFNHPPQITSVPVRFAHAGQAYEYDVTAFDQEAEPITFSLVGTVPSGMAIDATTGKLTWTPPVDATGSVDVTVKAADASGSDTQAYRLDLVRDALQLLSPSGNFEAPVGQTLTLDLTANYAKAGFRVSPLPDHATFSGHTLTFTPTAGQVGTYTIGCEALFADMHDARGIVINVTRPNHAPVLQPVLPQTVDAGQTLIVALQATDQDGDPLAFSAPGLSLPNAVFDELNHQLLFHPSFQQSGPFSVLVQVSDGQTTAQQTVSITVRAVAPPTQVLDLVVNKPQNPTFASTQSIGGSITGQAGTSAGSPLVLITGVNPSSVRQGHQAVVTLTGLNTDFTVGSPAAIFGDGITVQKFEPLSATQAKVTIQADTTATLGVRQVHVKQDLAEIPSVVGFLVEPGAASLTGRAIDSFTKQPLGGARVAINGTTLSTLTKADGTFQLDAVPPANQLLVVTLANYAVKQVDVAAVVNQTMPLGDLALDALARPFNPGGTLPRAATLASVLDRGVSGQDGGLTLEQAKALIIDTILAVPGDDVGVVDEAGTQLNPRMIGGGLLTLKPLAVERQATRLIQGDVYTIRDIAEAFNGMFRWVGELSDTGKVVATLQEAVNNAWAKPADPNSALPIILFNEGHSLSAQPPIITPDTRLNSFQAFMMMSSLFIHYYPILDDALNILLKNQGVDPKSFELASDTTGERVIACSSTPERSTRAVLLSRVGGTLSDALFGSPAYAESHPAGPGEADAHHAPSGWSALWHHLPHIIIEALIDALIAAAVAVMVAIGITIVFGGGLGFVTAAGLFAVAKASFIIGGVITLISKMIGTYMQPGLQQSWTPTPPTLKRTAVTDIKKRTVKLSFDRSDSDLKAEADAAAGGFFWSARAGTAYVDPLLSTAHLEFRYHLWKFPDETTTNVHAPGVSFISDHALIQSGQKEGEFIVPVSHLDEGPNYLRVSTAQFYRGVFIPPPDAFATKALYKELEPEIPPSIDPVTKAELLDWRERLTPEALESAIKSQEARLQALHTDTVDKGKLLGLGADKPGLKLAEASLIDVERDALEKQLIQLRSLPTALADKELLHANAVDYIMKQLRRPGAFLAPKDFTNDASPISRELAKILGRPSISLDPALASSVNEYVSSFQEQGQITNLELTQRAQLDALSKANRNLAAQIEQASLGNPSTFKVSLALNETVTPRASALTPPKILTLNATIGSPPDPVAVQSIQDELNAEIAAQKGRVSTVESLQRANGARFASAEQGFQRGVFAEQTAAMDDLVAQIGQKEAQYRRTMQEFKKTAQQVNELEVVRNKTVADARAIEEQAEVTLAQTEKNAGKLATLKIGKVPLGNVLLGVTATGEFIWSMRDGIKALTSELSAVLVVVRHGDTADLRSVDGVPVMLPPGLASAPRMSGPAIQLARHPAPSRAARMLASVSTAAAALLSPIKAWTESAFADPPPPTFSPHFQNDPDGGFYPAILRTANDNVNPKAGFLVRDFPFNAPSPKISAAGFPSDFIAVDSKGRVYLENANSNDAFGGRIFRYVGNPLTRELVGTINYFSLDLMFARAAQPVAMGVGDFLDDASGLVEDVFVANADAPFTDPGLVPKKRILRVPVHLTETNPAFAKGQNRNRIVGQPYAEHPDFQFSGPSDLVADARPMETTGHPRNLYFSDEENLFVIQQDPHTKAVSVKKLVDIPGRRWSGIATDSLGNLLFADHQAGEVFALPVDLVDAIADGSHTVITSDGSLDLQGFLLKVGLDRPGDIQLDDYEARYIVSTAHGFQPFNFSVLGRYSPDVLEIHLNVIGKDLPVTLRPTRGRIFIAGFTSEGLMGKTAQLRVKRRDPVTGQTSWTTTTIRLSLFGPTILKETL